MTATYEYGPFGELLRSEGPMAKGNPFRFSTKYQDEESDLVYYGLRYYRADTSRWLNRDPIGEDGGLNLYGFVGNDGINFVDPDGRWGIQFGDVNIGYGNPYLAFDGDSFNSAVPSGNAAFDYYRQSVASATGFGFLGDYDPCDEWLGRTRGLGRASMLALQIFGPLKVGGWAASGTGWLRSGTALALDGYSLYESASAIGTGAGRVSAGDYWGVADVALGSLGIKPGLSGVMSSGGKLAAGGKALLAAESGSRYLTSEALGRRIYKNLDDFDGARPAVIDRTRVHPEVIKRLDAGASNLDLMRDGYAPIGRDGLSINLHHVIGSEPGPMVELLASTHQRFSRQLHGLIEDGASFRNNPRLRYQYTKFQENYWKLRAQDFE